MSKSLRIAIADDEAEIRRYYEKTLARLGHQVIVSVEDGHELVAGCNAQPLDLIITDIRMPGMDGIKAARLVCEKNPVPVVVVSSLDAAELDQLGCEHVVAFLTKPIKAEQLAAAITEAANTDVGTLPWLGFRGV